MMVISLPLLSGSKDADEKHNAYTGKCPSGSVDRLDLGK
jgi:hypothetical protein